MILQTISFTLSLLTVIGLQMIYSKNKIGCLVSMIANLSYAFYWIYQRQWGALALMIILSIQAFIGYINWSTPEKAK